MTEDELKGKEQAILGLREETRSRFWLGQKVFFGVVVLGLGAMWIGDLDGWFGWSVGLGTLAIAALAKWLIHDKATNSFLCPQCDKNIPADLKWVCGHCDTMTEGIGTDHFFRCSRWDCKGKDAPGYQCHRCGQTIWFVEKRQGQIARMFTPASPGETDEAATESHKKQIREREQEAELARKTRELREEQFALHNSAQKLNRATHPPAVKSKSERVVEKVSEILEANVIEKVAWPAALKRLRTKPGAELKALLDELSPAEVETIFTQFERDCDESEMRRIPIDPV